jgi:threonine aldolase
MINLISDTVTKPSKEMLEAMFNAEVGDDVFGTDTTTNELQRYAADLFGKEAALFCPSGTMTNQLAIKIHTQPLDEVIAEINSHIYQYESAGFAFHSGVSIQLIEGKDGILDVKQLENAIKPKYDWLPRTKLLILENTVNKAGGNYYTLEQMQSISDFCRANGLAIHLDGARLFNALIETGDDTKAIGNLFDSISICLSKGLGAPVGSLLLGDADFIAEAKRFRKVMGGGMRQTGYLAAAGLYALQNNITRLREDHVHADLLSQALRDCSYVTNIKPVKTNIVIFDIDKKKTTGEEFIAYLSENKVSASLFGPQTIRLVTHLDVDRKMIMKVTEVLRSY